MKNLICLFLLCFLCITASAQQSHDITFSHDGLTVYGTFTTPNGSGRFPTIIINPGSGANDRDGTIVMAGGNYACLYPELNNNTLRTYKELSNALVDSGYAVLRYDKLEYTYPSSLGQITFHKLWLPVESAINYVKTRNDVDTTQIVLIGHSEGSSLIPFIAKGRKDVKALISIAGARTPFDSILAYQIVNIAKTCGGSVSDAQEQARQILYYFSLVRKKEWDGSTPDLFGISPSVWYDYFVATDSVAANYNSCNLPVLFTGMGLDINVPPAELIRFQNDVSVTHDFWSIPGTVHYMTPSNIPHISTVLTDTVLYWLRRNNIVTSVNENLSDEDGVQMYPNPCSSSLSISIQKQYTGEVSVMIKNILGQQVFTWCRNDPFDVSLKVCDVSGLPKGVYLLYVVAGGKQTVRKIIKQ